MFGNGVKQVVKAAPGVVASGVGKFVEITKQNANNGIVMDEEAQKALVEAVNATVRAGLNLSSEQINQIAKEVSIRMQETQQRELFYMQRQFADQFKEQQNDLIRFYANRPEVKPAFDEAVRRYSISDEERQKIAEGVRKNLEENGSLKGLSSEEVEKTIGEGVQKQIKENLQLDQDFENLIKENLLNAMTENPDSISDILGSGLSDSLHDQLAELGEKQESTLREALLKRDIKADADFLKQMKEAMPEVKVVGTQTLNVANMTEERVINKTNGAQIAKPGNARDIRAARKANEMGKIADDVVEGYNNAQIAGNVTPMNQGRKGRRKNSLAG